MRQILLLLAFICLLSLAFADEEVDYRGAIRVELASDSLEAGGTLDAQITLINNEDFPLADSHVVVNLVKGTNFYYPPQSFDTDNVFFEQTIPNINLPAKASKTITFSYALPADLSPGTYRMDVYFRNKKTFISGIPHLFNAPTSVQFTVSGTGVFPEAKILRTKTVFDGVEGQLSFPIEPGAEFEGNVFIKNTSSIELSGLEVFVGLCDWDDTRCEEFSPSATKPVDSLSAGEEKEIALSLNAPTEPSAYSIRIELRDSTGKLLSMFRNRAIVAGATKKIKKLYTDSYYYKAGSAVKLHSFVGPSPDHFTYPVLEGSSLAVSVTDLKSSAVVFQQSVPLQEDWQSNDFQFNTGKELSNFEACAEVLKAGHSFDKYCYSVDSTDFAFKELAGITIEWQYSPELRELGLELCSLSGEGVPTALNATYSLREKTAMKLMALGTAAGNGCVQNTLQGIFPGEYLLSVVNSFNGSLVSEEISALTAGQCFAECNDSNPCTDDSCSGSGCVHKSLPDGTTCAPNAACSSGQCAEALDSVNTALLAVLALILAGMAFLIYRSRKK